MIPFRPLVRLSLLGLAFIVSGCFHSREIERIRSAVEAETPGTDYDRRIVVSLGPASLQLSRLIVGLVDDPDARAAGAYLGDVRRVKLGVFRSSGDGDFRRSTLPRRLRRDLERNDWELALRVRNEDELVWLYFRERRGAVRDVFLTVANDEDLVIVRFKGRLDRMVARAMDQYGPGWRTDRRDGDAPDPGTMPDSTRIP